MDPKTITPVNFKPVNINSTKHLKSETYIVSKSRRPAPKHWSFTTASLHSGLFKCISGFLYNPTSRPSVTPKDSKPNKNKTT